MKVYEVLDRTNENINVYIMSDFEPLKSVCLSYYDGRNSIDPKYNDYEVVRVVSEILTNNSIFIYV